MPSQQQAISKPRFRLNPVLVRLMRRPGFYVGGGVVLLWLVLAVSADWLAPFPPNSVNVGTALTGPSWDHLMGTDAFGRDVFSRVLHGARMSLLTGLGAVTLSAVIGVPIGAVAGFYQGKIGAVLMRLIDTLLAFPALVLAMALAASIGTGITGALVAVGVVGIPEFARVAHGQALVVSSQEYIEASRALGVKRFTVLRRHVLPNSAGAIIVQYSLGAGFAILTAAALSYLGLGVQSPTAEWGLMISQGSAYVISGQWWVAAAPGLAVLSVVLAFNLLGDAIRDAFDPRSSAPKLKKRGLISRLLLPSRTTNPSAPSRKERAS